MTTNQNSKLDSRTFRNVMSLFATGVTVIATRVNGTTHGMTANAVASVSLDPLLVLVCVQKNAHMAAALYEAGQFSINILNKEQQPLSNYFAGIWDKETDPPPFRFIPWEGGLRLEGAIGAVACKITEFLEGGDHWIIIGAVTDLHQEESPANPLLFYAGKYNRLCED